MCAETILILSKGTRWNQHKHNKRKQNRENDYENERIHRHPNEHSPQYKLNMHETEGIDRTLNTGYHAKQHAGIL